MNRGFSILICTYNGAARLTDTMRHLAGLQLPPDEHVELIVIDNASSDNSSETACAAWQALHKPFSLRLLYESEPGKMHALGKGVHAARYDLLIVCDDDNWLAPDYLPVAREIMDKDPGIAILGGQSKAVAETDIPEWFSSVSADFACGRQMPGDSITTGIKPLWGAGMVIRTLVAQKIFDSSVPTILSCRKGYELISGGDDEICYRAWLMGYHSFYTDALRLQHFQPAERMTPAYRQRLQTGFLQQSHAIGTYHRAWHWAKLPGTKRFVLLGSQLLSGLWGVLTGQRKRRLVASDYAYFATGWAGMGNPVSRVVRQFMLQHGAFNK